MQRVVWSTIIVLLVSSLALPNAHAWRKSYKRPPRHEHQSSYQHKDENKFYHCEEQCKSAYGENREKCKELPLDEKKVCTAKARSCYTKCWNKYH